MVVKQNAIRRRKNARVAAHGVIIVAVSKPAEVIRNQTTDHAAVGES
jgi:hypothetical protein